VPESAFADSGDGSEYWGPCEADCAEYCGSNNDCYQSCASTCATNGCSQYCNGDSTCQGNCCNDACGDDTNCYATCAAGLPNCAQFNTDCRTYRNQNDCDYTACTDGSRGTCWCRWTIPVNVCNCWIRPPP
jgi:hypothetical protein